MNPLLGVFFHWLGGLSSASFYVPYRGVKRWSWEIYWLTGGLFSWLIAPWLIASLRTQDLSGVLGQAPRATILWPIFFGILWGFGGLTYGLTMRYLGLSLGMAVVLGLCTVFGTLIPPLFQGDFASKLLDTVSVQLQRAPARDGIGPHQRQRLDFALVEFRQLLAREFQPFGQEPEAIRARAGALDPDVRVRRVARDRAERKVLLLS